MEDHEYEGKECCFNCKFALDHEECHRYPPTVFMAPVDSSHYDWFSCHEGEIISWFPEVDRLDWCGEFVKREII